MISTRILGRRTAPFPPFLIPHRAPAWCYPKILVLMLTCSPRLPPCTVRPSIRMSPTCGRADEKRNMETGERARRRANALRIRDNLELRVSSNVAMVCVYGMSLDQHTLWQC